MAKARITLLETGTHHARQGKLHATPARCARWAENIRKMAAYNPVPLAWGHDKSVVPGGSYDRAKLNAGDITGAHYDPATGKLDVELSAPGLDYDPATGNLTAWTRLANGVEVKTAISKVSAYINDWTDGKGRDWPDSVLHVALTPLPVVAGQGGFRELGAEMPDGGFFLGTDTRVGPISLATKGGDPMAGEYDEEAAKKKTPPAEDAPAADAPLDEEPAADATPPAPPEEAPVPSPPAVPDPAEQHFKQALMALQGLGLALPDDTTPQNFAERVCIAAHALAHFKAQDEKEELADPENPDMDPKSAGGAPPAGGAVEEQRPVMLSTISDPIVREVLTERQEATKANALKRIDKLKGLMPVYIQNELRDKVNGYELSLTPGHKVADVPFEVELSIWEKTAKHGKAAKARHLAKANEEPRPASDNKQAQEAAGDELANRTMSGVKQ